MTALAPQIADYARRLFDVVGIRRLSGDESLLVLGLESTPERNLDEFGLRGDTFLMYGFKKHFGPRLASLLDFIRGKGFTAEPVGQYGYPNRGEVNLKEAAIRTGLGQRGKSTVVLHPVYGHRLRFAAVRTEAPLEPTPESVLAEEESPFCQGCTRCVDDCPVEALEPYQMPEASICLSNVSIMAKEHGRLVLCDRCLHVCPAGQGR